MNDFRMVLPRRVESQIADPTYGKFIISPLERGYGHTLGSSLQRVLLSSIRGAAVTGVRVNEGLDIFARIPGVRENMAQLVLQLKQLKAVIAGREDGLVLLKLEFEGTGTVSVGDLIVPPSVRLQDPSMYLFTADEPTAVEMEIALEQSTGYRVAGAHNRLPESFLPIDANFSPVERVVYDVDSARVRQKTNYDKLVLDIWTDGTLTPQEALSKSSVALIQQFQAFDPESDILVNPEKYLPPEPEPEPEANPLYDVPIEVLDLSTRVFNSLRRTGITSVGDVIDMLDRGEDAMLAIRNFGQTSLDELVEKLVENGYMAPGTHST